MTRLLLSAEGVGDTVGGGDTGEVGEGVGDGLAALDIDTFDFLKQVIGISLRGFIFDEYSLQ